MNKVVQDNQYSDLIYFNKENLLISPHVYKIFKLLGFNYLEELFLDLSSNLRNFLQIRLDRMFYNSKQLLEKKIEPDMAKIKMDFFHPLFLSCKMDLKNGLINLLYGNSINFTTILVNDLSMDLKFGYETHLEQGILTEFNFLTDIFKEKDRTIKIPLKEAYNLTKSVIKTSRIIQRFLKEKKEKETLEYTSSFNSLFFINLSNYLNNLLELSNYENLGFFWDGFNTKTYYKFPEPSIISYPNFPFVKSLIMSSRYSEIRTLGKLSAGRNLALHQIEDEMIAWIKKDFPEIYEPILLKMWEQGIPTPKMSMESSINVSALINNKEELTREFPKGSHVNKKNLNLMESDYFIGYYTDISEEFEKKQKISPKNIISKGFGK
ncbi:MAG: hypothetical protein EAX96_15145 [Candidatus Lokiarchaeota archaeon]|nr:hypothetical protein [Candidatus Lokiarchaeota archaeon]